MIDIYSLRDGSQIVCVYLADINKNSSCFFCIDCVSAGWGSLGSFWCQMNLNGSLSAVRCCFCSGSLRWTFPAFVILGVQFPGGGVLLSVALHGEILASWGIPYFQNASWNLHCAKCLARATGATPDIALSSQNQHFTASQFFPHFAHTNIL